MKQVKFLYHCTRCRNLFNAYSTMSPKDAATLMDSYIYGTEPSTAALHYSINDYEKHECEAVKVPETFRNKEHTELKRIGIGKLIGYTVFEVPDTEDEDAPNLRKVKG